MKYSSRYIVSILFLLVLIGIHAETVEWSIQPRWDIVDPFGENLLRVQEDGKWGIFSYSGKPVVQYGDYKIADIHEGKFLVYNPQNYNQLIYIGDQNGTLTKVQGIWFISEDYPYFSEGLLPVMNDKDKWGYMNARGIVSIKADYLNAFPFFYSLAAVEYKKDKWTYLKADGQSFGNEFFNVEEHIRFASSYTKIDDSTMALVLVKDRLYLMGLNGRKLSKFLIDEKGLRLISAIRLDSRIIGDNSFYTEFNTEGEIKYIDYSGIVHRADSKPDVHMTFPKGRKIDIRDDIGELNLNKQFQQITPLTSDYILVQKNNKYGLIKINRNQRVALSLENGGKVKDGNVEFTLSGDALGKTKVYVLANNNINYLAIDSKNGIIKVPDKFIDTNKQVTVGIEMDGIRFEPKGYPIESHEGTKVVNQTVKPSENQPVNQSVKVHVDPPVPKIISVSVSASPGKKIGQGKYEITSPENEVNVTFTINAKSSNGTVEYSADKTHWKTTSNQFTLPCKRGSENKRTQKYTFYTRIKGKASTTRSCSVEITLIRKTKSEKKNK